MFGSCSEPIKANKIISYGTRDSQHSIRSTARKRRQLMTGRSPLVSTVHANCLRTALRGSDSEPKETNACNNDPSSSRHMYPLGTFFIVWNMIWKPLDLHWVRVSNSTKTTDKTRVFSAWEKVWMKGKHEVEREKIAKDSFKIRAQSRLSNENTKQLFHLLN